MIGGRIQHLYAHDSLCLLRHVFSFSKILHMSPCFLSTELEFFNQLQTTLLGSIANIDLFVNDLAWTHTTLPVWSGGLGIRSVTQLAPSAFLVSAAGSSDLVCQLPPPRLRDAIYPEQKVALKVWRISHQEEPPTTSVCAHQKAWDTPIVNAAFEHLLQSAPDDMSRACLLAAHRSESGTWLNALPVSALGLRMDDDTVRVAMGLHLYRTPLYLPYVCHHCGAEVVNLGTHGLSCRKSQGRHPQHAGINSLIQRHLSAAGILAHLEPTGMCRSDGKCPDGTSIMPWPGVL